MRTHHSVNVTAAEAATAATIDPTGVMGVVVSWDFGTQGTGDAVAVPRETVAHILSENGFDHECCPALDTEEALARASRDVRWGSRFGIAATVVRLKADAGCPASYGVLVTETGTENATGKVGARIRIAGGGVEVAPPLDGPMHEQAEKAACAMRAHAQTLLTTASNADLASMLGRLRTQLFALSMRRNGGGVYFLPSGPNADRFIAVLDGLERATANEAPHRRFLAHVTVLRGDARNVATWSRNAAMTFEQEIEELTSALAEMANRDNVRDSSWDRRRAECAALQVRAREFAGLLEGNLGRVTGALATLDQRFGSAQAAAQAAAGQAASAFLRIHGAGAPPTPKAAPAGQPTGKDALRALSAFSRL